MGIGEGGGTGVDIKMKNDFLKQKDLQNTVVFPVNEYSLDVNNLLIERIILAGVWLMST